MDATAGEGAEKLIPVYGFLQGDTMGLLLLGYENETVGELGQKLCASAAVRVATKQRRMRVKHQGTILDPRICLAEANIKPLDRIDVFFEDQPSS